LCRIECPNENTGSRKKKQQLLRRPTTSTAAPKIRLGGKPPTRGTPIQSRGWVLDCVTWEKKWESPTLDADPHEFLFDRELASEGHVKMKDTFVQIFEKRDWPAKDSSYSGLQASGPGSMLKNSQGVAAALHVVINKIKTYLGKSSIALLDLPCGDMQWMGKFLGTRNDVRYTGADIVPQLIEHNREAFHRLPRTKFIEHDIVNFPLNQTFDLILCRDMLQHLWKADAMKAIHHLSSSGSHFLLATTFLDTTHNGEVEKEALGGRKYSYNLELPPFSLEPPICTSYDWNVEHLALWQLPVKQKYEY
jgi:hypothetical protein